MWNEINFWEGFFLRYYSGIAARECHFERSGKSALIQQISHFVRNNEPIIFG